MAGYDYPAFIEELRERDAEVPALMAKQALHKDTDFQRWRHAVIDAIQRIEIQDLRHPLCHRATRVWPAHRLRE